MQRAEAEQGLEAGKGRAASVVAEDELVEVGRQVLGRGPAVSAVQPCLEVGDGAMRARQQLLAGLARWLRGRWS